jgi:hypothetical protein
MRSWRPSVEEPDGERPLGRQDWEAMLPQGQGQEPHNVPRGMDRSLLALQGDRLILECCRMSQLAKINPVLLLFEKCQDQGKWLISDTT